MELVTKSIKRIIKQKESSYRRARLPLGDLFHSGDKILGVVLPEAIRLTEPRKLNIVDTVTSNLIWSLMAGVNTSIVMFGSIALTTLTLPKAVDLLNNYAIPIGIKTAAIALLGVSMIVTRLGLNLVEEAVGQAYSHAPAGLIKAHRPAGAHLLNGKKVFKRKLVYIRSR